MFKVLVRFSLFTLQGRPYLQIKVKFGMGGYTMGPLCPARFGPDRRGRLGTGTP